MVSIALSKARQRWGRSPSLTALREEVASLLQAHGSIMSFAELSESVLATRGSTLQGEPRHRAGAAVVRAALDTETGLEAPRWACRRIESRALVARGAEAEASELLGYAVRLGRVADSLASQDPIPAPSTVLEKLRQAEPPAGGVHLPSPRIVHVAAAASSNAAVSGRLELYPRGLPAARALRLSQGAILGPRLLPLQHLRDRVESRFPHAERLPARPALDRLLEEAGLELRWDPAADAGRGAYVPPHVSLAAVSTPVPSLQRHATSLGGPAAVTPEVAQARQFEARLKRAERDGAFLVLLTAPEYLQRAEQELNRRFQVDRKSLDELMIGAMREVAGRAAVDWSVVRQADQAEPGSSDWTNLQQLVGQAVESFEPALGSAEKTTLLTEPGLLARYEQLGLVERLRERVGRPSGEDAPSLHGLWLLVACDDQQALPVVDGRPVPVVTPGEWARIPIPWLENVHRGGRSSTELKNVYENGK